MAHHFLRFFRFRYDILLHFLLSWNFLPSDIYESGDKLALGVLAVVCVSTFVKIQS